MPSLLDLAISGWLGRFELGLDKSWLACDSWLRLCLFSLSQIGWVDLKRTFSSLQIKTMQIIMITTVVLRGKMSMLWLLCMDLLVSNVFCSISFKPSGWPGHIWLLGQFELDLMSLGWLATWAWLVWFSQLGWLKSNFIFTYLSQQIIIVNKRSISLKVENKTYLNI